MIGTCKVNIQIRNSFQAETAISQTFDFFPGGLRALWARPVQLFRQWPVAEIDRAVLQHVACRIDTQANTTVAMKEA